MRFGRSRSPWRLQLGDATRSCSRLVRESALREDLARIPDPLRSRLEKSGFDPERLIALAGPLFARARGEAGLSAEERNRVNGLVELPSDGDLPDAPSPGTASYERLSAIGLDALARGEVAFCVLAGGMATRARRRHGNRGIPSQHSGHNGWPG